MQADKRKSHYAANQGKRHDHQYERSFANRAKRPKQQRENKQSGDRDNHSKPLDGALLVFELSAPCDVVARRQFNLLGDLPLRLCDKAALVASQQVCLDCGIPSSRFAVDARGSLSLLDFRDITQAHRAGATRQIDLNAGNIVDRVAIAFRQPDGNVETLVAVKVGIDSASRKRGLDSRVHIGDIDAKTCNLLAIYHNIKFALATDFHGSDVGSSWNVAQNGRNLFAFLR